MSERQVDLGSLFGVALEAMSENRQQINDLDGYNGNHGDNMVQNLQMIQEVLAAEGSKPPAEALEHASQKLREQGQGGTSQYYANGLNQAAKQLEGRSGVDSNDVMGILQSLLGAIPNEGHTQQQTPVGGSVLGQVLGLGGGGQQAVPQAVPQPQQDELDIGDAVNVLLPAGLAFLQAKQAGADTTSAATQALMSVLMGGQMNPLQAGTPQAAAGSLVAQSLLGGLTGGSGGSGGVDLGGLFGTALQAMTSNQQQINQLDGYNGNHGDNMVANLGTIVQALNAKGSPSEALRYAGRELKAHGQGGTSRYYAKGLSQAAKELKGRSELNDDDVMTVVQSLLGAIPAQGDPKKVKDGGSVLEHVIGMAGGRRPQAETPRAAAGSLMAQSILQALTSTK
jgi:hypothetical protein